MTKTPWRVVPGERVMDAGRSGQSACPIRNAEGSRPKPAVSVTAKKTAQTRGFDCRDEWKEWVLCISQQARVRLGWSCYGEGCSLWRYGHPVRLDCAVCGFEGSRAHQRIAGRRVTAKAVIEVRGILRAGRPVHAGTAFAIAEALLPAAVTHGRQRMALRKAALPQARRQALREHVTNEPGIRRNDSGPGLPHRDGDLRQHQVAATVSRRACPR